MGSVACTPTTKLRTDVEHFGDHGRVGTTQGGAIAVTYDERIAVVCNRTDGTVSVLRLDAGKDATQLVRQGARTDFAFHPLNESKPWAAVIGADDDSAYVLIRGQSKVVRITGLHSGRPVQDPEEAGVGSEPTAIVISPSGKSIYVANWADGTVSSISTGNMSSYAWDLNARLAATGRLGPLISGQRAAAASAVWDPGELEMVRRPGLAHPRALALTDNGDAEDNDEMLYATEFFAQPLVSPLADVDDVDHSREGLVYPITVGKGAGHAPLDPEGAPIQAIPIAAVPSVGFVDAEPSVTGCFPNQLYSAVAAGSRLYVTSVCASPSGPVEAGPGTPADPANFKTLVHSAVFVIDTVHQQELPEQRLVLTQALAQDLTVNAQSPRMPVIPNEIRIAPADDEGATRAYVSAFGSAAVFVLRLGPDGAPLVEPGRDHYIDLGKTALPTGLALLSGERALVADDWQAGVDVLDLATRSAVAAVRAPSADTSSDPDEQVSHAAREGRRLFATGLAAWSFQGAGFSSCESCHPDGLSDGVTWRFARGPRRTISLAGTYYGDAPTQRLLLWGANIDEVHDVEVIARNLSGGAGGVVWSPYAKDQPSKDCRLLYDGKHVAASANPGPICPHPMTTSYRENGLNGSLGAITRTDANTKTCLEGDPSCDVNASLDWGDIDAFIRTVKAPRAPSGLDAGLEAKGQRIFESRRCAACHAGPGWTLSRVFYTRGHDANGKIPFDEPPVPMPAGIGLMDMLGQLRLQSYTLPPGAPAAFLPGPGVYQATFRNSPGGAATPEDARKFVFANGFDQIQCAVRTVGTFPDQSAGENHVGISPAGAPAVDEVRLTLNAASMKYEDLLAQGKTGFNIPSLLGVAASAPYFHAGNARSLEELFDVEFAPHAGVFGDAPPTADEIRGLVTYLLSIDETASTPTPLLASKLGFDPDLCASFQPQATNK